MHFTATMSAAALALAATTLALPAAEAPINIEMTVLDAHDNSTYWLAYKNNFFGNLALLPVTDRSDAVTFGIQPNGTLKSIEGQAIGVVPFDFKDQVDGDITYTDYTGEEGTYISKHNLIKNSNPEFYRWEVCYSQYGAGLGYVSKAFNQTYEAEGAGYNWPCYEAIFRARRDPNYS